MKQEKLDFSLVIPCYNEMQVLRQSLRELTKVLDTSTLKYEIIFIDDGSTDGTRKLGPQLAERYPNVKWYNNEKNLGRGGAVTRGINLSNAEVVGFIDIDLETPAHHILPLVMKVKEGYDIVTGWRIYKLDKTPFHRWVLSKGYNFLIRNFLGVKLKDTETGCKFFNRERIIPMLALTQDKHWFWDTEIMVIPYLNNYKIYEMPTLFLRKPDINSTVKIANDTKKYFLNLIKFKKRIDNEFPKSNRKH